MPFFLSGLRRRRLFNDLHGWGIHEAIIMQIIDVEDDIAAVDRYLEKLVTGIDRNCVDMVRAGNNQEADRLRTFLAASVSTLGAFLAQLNVNRVPRSALPLTSVKVKETLRTAGLCRRLIWSELCLAGELSRCRAEDISPSSSTKIN